MSISPTDGRMTSRTTTHFAERDALPPSSDTWRVSWLPDRAVTRNEAMTALAIAEVVNTKPMHAHSRYSPLVDQLAAELGLTGPDAVIRACQDPDLLADRSSRCPCGPADSCPRTSETVPSSRPFQTYTASDWSAYHEWVAHWLRAHADRADTTGDVPPELVERWRTSAEKHAGWATDPLAVPARPATR